MAQKKSQGGGGTSNRGFASMNAEQQRAIARKGGEAVSMNRAHMAEIEELIRNFPPKGSEAGVEVRNLGSREI